MEDNSSYRDSILLYASAGKIASFIPFKPNTTGLNALLGSGELNLISEDIRFKLNNYYDHATEQIENNDRTTTLTRNTVQDKLFKIVVTRERIAMFTGLKISPETGKTEKFIADDEIPTELLFISEIEKARNRELNELKIAGAELIAHLSKR
jgi:hypothetical protein